MPDPVTHQAPTKLPSHSSTIPQLRKNTLKRLRRKFETRFPYQGKVVEVKSRHMIQSWKPRLHNGRVRTLERMMEDPMDGLRFEYLVVKVLDLQAVQMLGRWAGEEMQ